MYKVSLSALLLYAPPKSNARPTDNLQKLQDDQKGRLRLFSDFFKFLDGDRTSNHLPNSGGLITLANRHERSGESGGGSHTTFPYAAEITVLFRLF